MTRLWLWITTAAVALPAAPLAARPMTATDMHMLHRLGPPSVNADGRLALFTISDTDLSANKRVNRNYLLDVDVPGAQPRPFLEAGSHDAVFGYSDEIYFLKRVGDHDQLFTMALREGETQLSDFGSDISGFKVSADGSYVVVWADRDMRCTTLDCPEVKQESRGGSARAYDGLFVRHWDTWAEPGVRSRLFGFAVKDDKLFGKGIALSGSLVGDTPSKPFGGGEEIALSADGKTVYFALREAGRIEATSTNLDIFSAPTDGSAAPTNLTADNDALDSLPALSPDGRTLAYVAMARPGYEADRQVLMLRDLASGQVRALTKEWDRSVGSVAWEKNGKSLLVTADDTLELPIWRVDAASGTVTRLTQEGHVTGVIPLPDGGALFTANSLTAPDELHRYYPDGRKARLTKLNDDLIAQLDPIAIEKFSFKGANGDTVWGFKVKPAATKAKLPIAMIVHGGPQSSFGNAWSYRWNPRLFATGGGGYGVVSVDFHGSTGYGQAFTDSIRNNYGGWPLEDLRKGLKHATDNDPQLIADQACALGASYGGYMMNWIESHWPDRFKCLVQHDGIFDMRAMAYETEELWFTEWDSGGKPYYEDPAAYERWNPVNHVAKWKTPMLVVTGEKDYRIPYSQGLAAFTALQRQEIPSRLVVFPDENHWVLKPNNSIRWYDEVFNWLEFWTARH